MTKKKAKLFTAGQVERKVLDTTLILEDQIATLKRHVSVAVSRVESLERGAEEMHAHCNSLRRQLHAPTTMHAKFPFGAKVFVQTDDGFEPGIVTSVSFDGEGEHCLGIILAAGGELEVHEADVVHARDDNPAFAIPGETDVLRKYHHSNFGTVAVDSPDTGKIGPVYSGD